MWANTLCPKIHKLRSTQKYFGFLDFSFCEKVESLSQFQNDKNAFLIVISLLFYTVNQSMTILLHHCGTHTVQIIRGKTPGLCDYVPSERQVLGSPSSLIEITVLYGEI